MHAFFDVTASPLMFLIFLAQAKQLKTFVKPPPTEIGLGPLLFNIYPYDFPSMTSQKYAYADDLALLYASQDWEAVEDTISQDMTTFSACLHTWRLKLTSTKTVMAPFILTTERLNMSLMFTTMATYCHSVQPQRILG